ncbi:MAG: hypothetical protein AB7I04_24205 [Pseudomonadales bacterium]
MPIEEITLSVPQSLPDSGTEQRAASATAHSDDRMVRRYRGLLRDSYRFAWTRRGRQKRQDTFEVAYRSLVKQLAQEITAPIEDRVIRLDARRSIYASLTGIIGAAASDQRRLRDRSRRLFGWGLALCSVGLGSLAVTLVLG